MPASRDFGVGCTHVPVAIDTKTGTLITIPVPILGYCRGCSNKTGENLVAIPEWHRVNLPAHARKVYDEAPFYGGECSVDSAAPNAADTGAADDATATAAATGTTPTRIKYLSSATLEASYTYPSTFIATRQAWNHEFSNEAVAVELSGITKQPLEGSGVLVGMGGVESEHAGPSYERGWGAEGVVGAGDGDGDGDGGDEGDVDVGAREQARVDGVKRMLEVWAGQAQSRREMGGGAWAGEGSEGAVGEGVGEGEQEMGTITIGYAGE